MARLPSLSPALVAVLATLGAALAIVVTTSSPASALLSVADGEAAPLPTIATRVAPRRPAADAPPLAVTIESLSPSVIPRKGQIRVTGSVTNNDTVAWANINVYPFVSATPMTTRAELVEAAATDPALLVGARITTPGHYDTIDRLTPGESLQFSLKVPRSALVGADGQPIENPGVYWFGVHALGEGGDGRDTNADGRARTFLPLVPSNETRSVDTALVIPLRREVAFENDGALKDVPGWTRTLSPAGTLRSLVDFGAAAGSRPITWLLDPALPDAVRQLVAGNPARYLGPTVAGATDGEGQTSSPSVTAVPEPSTSPTTDGGQDPVTDPSLAAAMDAGNAWLDRLHEALGQNQILALPYGDLDVGAAARHDAGLIDRATSRSGTVLEPWGLPMSPAVGSPSGYLDDQAIQAIDPDTTVLVTDRMFGDDPPGVANTAGHKLVVTSSGAAAGGPGPGHRLSMVSLRQRILSEAALRLLNPGVRPLVVVLPAGWTPQEGSTEFFEGLDVGWLHLTSVGGATDREPTPYDAADLLYPRRQGVRELDAANFQAAEALIGAGETMQNVLTRNDRISSVVSDEALHTVSYASRARPDAARVAADRSRMWIQTQLGRIEISAPRGVTLSSSSGKFATTISNGLDQPVTVRIEAQTGGRLRIRGPAKLEIAAHGRTTVLLNAQTHTPGVHNVTLVLTDCPEDPSDPTLCKPPTTPIGSSDVLPIRSAQVSKVIWLIIGTGAALLFGAIFVRLVRRLRRARHAASEPGPDAHVDAGPHSSDEPAR